MFPPVPTQNEGEAGHAGAGIDENRVNWHRMSLVNDIGVTGDGRSVRAELPKPLVAIHRSEAPAASGCGGTASRFEGSVVLVAVLASGVRALGHHDRGALKLLVRKRCERPTLLFRLG